MDKDLNDFFSDDADNLEPQVTQRGLLHCQVCVPKDWTPEQARDWLQSVNPAGTRAGWIFVDSSEQLSGDQPIVECRLRNGFVHMVFVV